MYNKGTKVKAILNIIRRSESIAFLKEYKLVITRTKETRITIIKITIFFSYYYFL